LVLALFLGLAGCRPASPVPASPSTLRLFVEPDAGRTPLLSAIRKARSRIDLVIYLFTDETVARALEQAAGHGVHVRVLMEGKPYGGGASNHRMAERLRAAGVDVRFSSPAFRYTHEKSLVVDGTRGVIMTLNLTHTSFHRNREYGLIFTRSDWIQEMEQVFDADWKRTTPHLPAHPNLVWSPVNARETILHLIAGAHRRLDLEEPDLRDTQVVHALSEALKRGVRVRLVRSRPGNSEAVEWRHIRQMVAQGAKVGFLDTPYVHAKVILADDSSALVGSINLTMTSMDLNRELGAVVHSPEVIRSLRQMLDADWRAAAPVGQTSRPSPAPPTTGVLPPEEAGAHVGQTVTVEGVVRRTHDTGKVTFLDMTSHRDGLSIVIFARNYARFPAPPATYYKGKRIRVHGRVKMYRGAPEIIADGPSAIHLVP